MRDFRGARIVPFLVLAAAACGRGSDSAVTHGPATIAANTSACTRCSRNEPSITHSSSSSSRVHASGHASGRSASSGDDLRPFGRSVRADSHDATGFSPEML